ncbi:kelch domain-containing protein 3 [Trichonephila clavipes]|nr:kelch domain-containing protein 3 [Trichonephila clavipes]
MMSLEVILQFRKEEKVTRTQVSANKGTEEQQECSYWPRNGSLQLLCDKIKVVASSQIPEFFVSYYLKRELDGGRGWFAAGLLNPRLRAQPQPKSVDFHDAENGKRGHGCPPSKRDFHSASVIDNCMYIFGGRGLVEESDVECYPNEIMYLDTNSMMWSAPCKDAQAPCGRRSHTAVVYKGEIYIIAVVLMVQN